MQKALVGHGRIKKCPCEGKKEIKTLRKGSFKDSANYLSNMFPVKPSQRELDVYWGVKGSAAIHGDRR